MCIVVFKHKISTLLMILILTILGMNINHASASVSISDPVGDFPFPDITKLYVNISGSNMIIEITHAEDVFDPLGLHTSAGVIFMDTDFNKSNGIDNTGHGADFNLEYTINRYYTIANIISSRTSTDISSRVSINGKKIIFKIPLYMLNNDDGKMRLFVTTREGIWIGSLFDRAPDYGLLNTTNGLVEIDFQGNKLAKGLVIDPIDPGYPDITKVNVSIDKGNFVIKITYREDLADSSITKGACAEINLDTDQRLATGFTNFGENPPTFGVDYRINYCIASIMGTPSAYIEGATSTDIGLPYNDGTFIYKDNLVSLKIPLGLMKFDEGFLFLHIYSYNPNTIASLRDIDDIPDYGKGALNTSNGKIQPLAHCLYNWVVVNDPNDDSTGFGLNGDEIISVGTCNSRQIANTKSIIIKTRLKSYDLDDSAFINIYLDIDQNPNTGLRMHNNDKTLGAEYMVSSAHDDYGVLHTYLTSLNNAKMVERKQLATPVGTQIVMTVPLELIGRDDGAIDMLAQTTNAKPFYEYDIAPNTGIIRLDKIPPGSITGLKNITYERNYINWTWVDPKNIDFSKVLVYINDIWKTNISKGIKYYKVTGLKNNTWYRISTHTVDYSGNVNKTWVNRSAKTAR